MDIKIKYKYLKHDIDQATYRIAGTRIEDITIRDDAQSSEIDSDKSYYRREIEKAVATLKALLTDRIVKATSPTDSDLSLSTSEWVFKIVDDENFSVDNKVLAELFHHFILQQVIFHWATIYAPDAVATITAEMESAQNALMDALYDLTLPVKHRRQRRTETSEISVVEVE